MDAILWWLALSVLVGGAAVLAGLCWWQEGRLQRAERLLTLARIGRSEGYRDLRAYRTSYSNLTKTHAELIQRQKEWLPEPKSLDAAFVEAERMADLRIMRQAGRVSRARSDAGPPAKVSRLSVRRAPRKPL